MGERARLRRPFRSPDLSDVLRVALLTLGDPGRLTGGYLFHQRMAQRAAAHGARIRFLSFPSWPFPLPALAARAVVRAAAGSEVLVLDSIAAAYLAPALVTGSRLPLVGMLHQPPGGVEAGSWRRAVQARLDRFAWDRAALLMVASDYLRERLVAQGTDPARVRVVPPGRDAAVPGSLDVAPGPGPNFLCVANWLPHKGIHELLAAFAPVSGRLHLAGGAPDVGYADRIRRQLETPELIGRVVVHGPVAPQEVAALYAAADVFVLPAHRETYGTVFTEAMTAGLPVVGWQAGNLPFLVTDGSEGRILPCGDVAALSAALQQLGQDAALRLAMGEAARRRAHTFPTWDDSAQRFFGAIREAGER